MMLLVEKDISVQGSSIVNEPIRTIASLFSFFYEKVLSVKNTNKNQLTKQN